MAPNLRVSAQFLILISLHLYPYSIAYENYPFESLIGPFPTTVSTSICEHPLANRHVAIRSACCDRRLSYFDPEHFQYC